MGETSAGIATCSLPESGIDTGRSLHDEVEAVGEVGDFLLDASESASIGLREPLKRVPHASHRLDVRCWIQRISSSV